MFDNSPPRYLAYRSRRDTECANVPLVGRAQCNSMEKTKEQPVTRYACPDNDRCAGDIAIVNRASQVIRSRIIGRKGKIISLAICRDFDTRWIGELPICFDGSPEHCAGYARDCGCIWHDDDAALFGGRWEHPTEALTLYPV